MADIFLSYASADRERAVTFVDAFEKAQWSVWWDDDVAVGDMFRDAIESQVTAAKCVVVLWSEASHASDFVRAEASLALKKSVLIPVIIGKVGQPLGFGERQAIDLSSWDGSPSDATFRRLLADLDRRFRTNSPQPADAPLPLPLIGVLPLPNRHFVGRELLLSSLHDALVSQDTAAHIHAVVGLGGVGKTQLVVEYAHRHTQLYKHIWWLPASEPLALRNRYTGLADELGLRQPGGREQAEIDAVRNWLGHNQDWLLVFDDAQAPGDVEGYLPPRPAGRVLITSTNPDWESVANVLRVPLFDADESVAFLLGRSGRGDDERAAAGDLARWLGGLPLALEQAAAYVVARQISFITALSTFRTDAKPFLKERGRTGGQASTLWAIWQSAYDEARTHSPTAVDVLRLCAFFAPGDIPRWLLDRGLESAEPDRHAALAQLRRYGLVVLTLHNVTVHGLLQEFLRERLSDLETLESVERVLRSIERGFPEDPSDLGSWKACESLLGHATAALEHGEALGADVVVRARLGDRLGVYLQGRGLFAAAHQRFADALQVLEKSDEDGTQVATVRGHLGTLLYESGDIDGARAHLEDALQIHRQRCGAESLEVAEDEFNLAEVVAEQGDLGRATELLEHALAIHAHHRGKEHLSVARDLKTLAFVHLRSGNLLKAQSEMAEALGVYAALQQAGHPDARFLQFIHRRLSEGVETANSPVQRFAEILAAAEEAFGETHPTVAEWRVWLADECLGEKDVQTAVAEYARALEIDTARYGRQHWKVGRDLLRLFVARAAAGEGDRASEHLVEAVGILAKVPRARTTGGDGVRLPRLPYVAGMFDEALESLTPVPKAVAEFERITDVVRRHFGTDDLLYACALERLAVELHEDGNHAKALEHLNTAMSVLQRHVGDDAARLAICYRHLGDVQAALEQLTEAQASYEQSLRILDAVGFPSPLERVTVLRQLYRVVIWQEQRASVEKAMAAAAQAAPVRSIQRPPTLTPSDILAQVREIAATSVGGDFLVSFANILADSGNLAEARTIHDQVLQMHLRTYDPRHVRVGTSLLTLGFVCERLNDLASAREYFERILATWTGPLALKEQRLAAHAASRLVGVLAALGDFAAVTTLLENSFPTKAAAASLDGEVGALYLRGWLNAADRALGLNTDSDAQRLYEEGFRRTEGMKGSEVFPARLAGLAAARGNDADVTARLRDALRVHNGKASKDAFWTALDHLAPTARQIPDLRPLDEALTTLRGEPALRSQLRSYRCRLSARRPRGWTGKTSLTLLSPDGQMNVIASSEPWSSRVRPEEYANQQGALLEQAFPAYRQLSFQDVQLLGGRRGFVREFEWAPSDVQSVTQIQAYYTENSRGYTATATTVTSAFAAVRVKLRQLLMSIDIPQPEHGVRAMLMTLRSTLQSWLTELGLFPKGPVFASNLSATVPDGWLVKSSITLLSPDGTVNLIASSEPLEASTSTVGYADAQGQALLDGFPGYQELAYRQAAVFDGHPGFIRYFSWTPSGAPPVVQMQAYHVEQDRAYVATVTTLKREDLELEERLRQLLDTVQIRDVEASQRSRMNE